MRVEYEPSIVDRILKAAVDAKRDRRVIKQIVLTHTEAEEFRQWADIHLLLYYNLLGDRSPFPCQYAGITIDVEPNGFRP